MNIGKKFLSLFFVLQFLACGSFFTENLKILRYTFAAESSAAEQLASLENTTADELTQFGAEAIEAGAETKRTKDEGKTKVIATNGMATCTENKGGRKSGCEKARPKISVIIPVYNVEPYLRECLDSVVNQTLQDIEIICIDDCSTDGSLAILQKYAQEDRRIKLIRQNVNQGAYVARNKGLDVATGEYIGFVDPDDYIELKTYEVAYNTAKRNDADIVIFGGREFARVSKYTSAWIKPRNIKYNGQSMRAFFDEKGVRPYIWNKIYNRAFLKEINFKFLDGRNGLDAIAMFQIFPYSKKLVFISDEFYHYRRGREGSANKLVWSNHSKGASLCIENLKRKIDILKNSKRLTGHEQDLLKVCVKCFYNNSVKQCFWNNTQDLLNILPAEIYNPEVMKKCDQHTQRLIRELEHAAAHSEKYQALTEKAVKKRVARRVQRYVLRRA